MSVALSIPLLSLPEDMREALAAAAGPVYSGDRFRRQLLQTPCSGVACIGDYVSQACIATLSTAWTGPLILVVDGKTRRESWRDMVVPQGFRVHRVRSPPGSLSLEAYTTICKLMEEYGRHVVFVEGEEDLIALAALDCGIDWTVVYGLPGVGGVVVHRCLRKPGLENSSVLAFKPGTGVHHQSSP
ncbi:conserved hypothetical protein [Aeropyrum pernix K1]|uniref:GTP-dependent dephospho-CoA kinase n=1 Tax=Aeropyrum pernix (strain ATCC 700893 / DSM 11879 / JCM 9820 / NBRC 100138 / K1) TaxID=272557 RepID=DPCKG_AERPE|nr:GTP-dependent dephospho-CoA kinase family protein [Aeropyrum pernix]Q9YFJ2.1 RecName: Full=GTP-dependent dephospho-CoA kinase; AltName: Full=Dephospho-coenzyme A kinase; Short=DPCK [Aeropyrum pernix K1]BAA79169.1 conserved hypothetical protein [Aeropyrum pernix K1]